jgi:hypothetical protein
MAAATHINAKRGSWSHPALRSPDRLRLGRHDFGYSDVASYELIAKVERDWEGQLLCSAVYGLAASAFLTGILLGALDWKYLIAVVGLGSIAAMSVGDALGTTPVTVYCLELRLHDGRQVSFVDADVRVAQALAQRIDAARRDWPSDGLG